jgi:hypothetical protein
MRNTGFEQNQECLRTKSRIAGLPCFSLQETFWFTMQLYELTLTMILAFRQEAILKSFVGHWCSSGDHAGSY